MIINRRPEAMICNHCGKEIIPTPGVAYSKNVITGKCYHMPCFTDVQRITALEEALHKYKEREIEPPENKQEMREQTVHESALHKILSWIEADGGDLDCYGTIKEIANNVLNNNK